MKRLAALLVCTLLMGACAGEEEPAPAEPVLTGLDVLTAESFAQLAGAKVGLISNHSGQGSDGRGIVEIFAAANNLELRALFSPEHGFDGKLDQAEIGDQEHRSGLVVHSLYGATRKPSADSLRGLDTLVFDIQDIGCRFYTYVSTMLLCMEAASEQGLRFVVLDRPNPIGGLAVAGPVLDPGLESFVGCHSLPLRHGMTIGELAGMLAAERKLDCQLQVIQMRGWQRGMLQDATGISWVDPSPNMRSLKAALLYPGVGLLEMTNLSVGRGTETPFEVLGAPWIDGERLAERIQQAHIQGLRVEAIRFTPDSSKHAKQECSGLRFVITDPDSLESVRLGMTLACALRDQHQTEWEMAPMQRLLGDEAIYAALQSGKGPRELVALWQAELIEFRARRALYLLYFGSD